MQPQDKEFLTPTDLVARWGGAVTIGTLANWRSKGRGPSFVKIGSRVVYRVADVTAYETAAKAATGEGACNGVA